MKKSLFEQLKSREGEFFKESKSKGGQWLNYKLLSVEPGEVSISVVVRPEMTNPLGNIHGGMIALISDEICGLTFYSAGRETFYTTVNLNVDFLLPAPEGSEIIAQGKVYRNGNRIAHVGCELFNAEGQLMARAASNLLNTGHAIFNLHNINS